MAERIRIASLDIDIDAILKSQSESLKVINSLKESQKQLRSEGKQSSTQFVEQEARLKNLNKAYRDNQKVAAAVISANGNLNNLLKIENKSTQELTDSRNQLIAISKQVRGDSAEEIALRNKLNNAIDEQTDALRGQSSQFVVGKDGIGEYAQAIEKALPANTLLGKSISFTKDILNIVTPIYNVYGKAILDSLKSIVLSAKGLEGMTAAQKRQIIVTRIATNGLKLFRAALAATGIGLIVIALASLVSFLGSTQKGIDKVNSVLKPLEVIFQRLLGVLQNLGESLFDAFSNPKQLITDLGDLVKKNIETRFNAVLKIFNRIKNFDFAGIGDDLLEAATGVEDIGDKTEKVFGNAKQFLKDSIDIGKELADLQIQIEETENQMILDRANLNTEFEKLKETAQDITKTEEERRLAAQRAIEVQNELLQKEQFLLDLKIKQKEIQNTLNDTDRDAQEELNQLVAERTNFEANASKKRVSARNLEKTINKEIESQRAQAAKKAADRAREAALLEVKNAEIALETFKESNKEKLAADGELNQARIDAALGAAIFIRDTELEILQDKLDKGLIAENEANLERIKLQNDFNERRAELEQQFYDQQEEKRKERDEAEKERLAFEAESEKELRLSNAESDLEFQLLQLEERRKQEISAAEKLGADTTAIEARYANIREDIEKRAAINKLQTISGVLGQAASLFKEQTALAKILGIAQATIDTYIGANLALKTFPGPLGTIQAGITIATGLANVAKISGVKFEKGGLQEIGGKRHSAGGTKFIGEDGTAFEAEQGELIGVLNRKAAAAFMQLNNAYANGTSSKGYFQNGAVFASGSPLVQSRFASGNPTGNPQLPGFDYNQLSHAVMKGYEAAKPPVTDIRDFYEVDNQVRTVEEGANV